MTPARMRATGIALVAIASLVACSGSDEASVDATVTQPTASSAPATAPSTDPASTDVTDSSIETTSSTDDTTPQATVPATEAVTPEEFTTVTARITKADGTTCEVCMWLADDGFERGRGLMGVTDLGAAAAMAFVFDQPTTGNFFMFQTVTPLSIAWFDADGAFVSSADMDPCLDADSAQCPRFGAAGEYTVAVEVFQGDLATIGITDGSSIEILAGTEAETCPAV